MFSSKDRNKIFVQKVYCENSNPAVEVCKLDRALREFSVEIKPGEGKMIEQRRLAQMVVETLKADTNFNIARVIFAGSVGKHTNVNKFSDVDCVCFINDEHPPFDKVLKQMYDFCNQTALRKINFYLYSSSLAEASVGFMKNSNGFANEIARLAKYWFKTQVQTSHISGASTMIELVAVYAARKGRRGKRKFNSYLKAFIKFLKLIMEFENLNVAFPRYNPKFKEHILGDTTKPRVVDPVNPYNNFAQYWSENSDAISVLKKSAYNTYNKLIDSVLYLRGDDYSIEKLF